MVTKSDQFATKGATQAEGFPSEFHLKVLSFTGAGPHTVTPEAGRDKTKINAPQIFSQKSK